MEVFREVFSNKGAGNIEGRHVKDVVDRLKEVKKQTEKLSKDLLSEFQRES